MGPDPIKSSMDRWAPTEVSGVLYRCSNRSKKTTQDLLDSCCCRREHVAYCHFIERYLCYIRDTQQCGVEQFYWFDFGPVYHLQEAKPLVSYAAHHTLILMKPLYLVPLVCMCHTCSREPVSETLERFKKCFGTGTILCLL